mgnify:CR=1 FL=1
MRGYITALKDRNILLLVTSSITLSMAKGFWEKGLRELVRGELPDFDKVIEELKGKLKALI